MDVFPENTGKSLRMLWWASAVLLFLVVFATVPKIYYVFVVLLRYLGQIGIASPIDPVAQKPIFLREIVAPIRGLALLISLAGLLPPLIRDILNSEKNQVGLPSVRLRNTLVIFFILCAIILPGKLWGGNLEYLDQSSGIFERGTDTWSFQRFLMPATAYMLFFRGKVFFWIFSLLCVIPNIYLTQLWFLRNNMQLKNWQLISIFTSAFIASKIQYPGTPDPFVHSFLLLLFIFPLSELAQLSLLALSVASHEASIFLFVPIALFFKERRLGLKYFLVMVLYALVWMFSVNFKVNSFYDIPQVEHFGTITMMLQNLNLEILGLFYANKLMWIPIIICFFLLARKRELKTAMQIGSLIASGLVMTFIGFDTVRLFAWSFLSILMSIKILYDQNNPGLQRLLTVTLILNLLIAPLYVDLAWARPPSGVYYWIYSMIGL